MASPYSKAFHGSDGAVCRFPDKFLSVYSVRKQSAFRRTAVSTQDSFAPPDIENDPTCIEQANSQRNSPIKTGNVYLNVDKALSKSIISFNLEGSSAGFFKLSLENWNSNRNYLFNIHV